MDRIKFLFILCIVIVSCRGNKSSEGTHSGMISENAHGGVDMVLMCELHENIDVIQNINNAVFIDDSTFFVISNKQIIKYNTTGQQLTLFEKIGGAPDEYISPALISLNDSSIYVWCSTTLKLLEYDFDGKFKGSITNYSSAIKNFKVYNDNYILFYSTGGAKQRVIDIYDRNKEVVIKSVGSFSEEDIVLSTLAFKPEIIINDDYVYYIKPSSANLYRFRFDKFEEEEIDIVQSHTFKVERVDDANVLINIKRDRLIEYLFNNSITNNIFLYNGGVLIKSETGKYVIDKNAGSINSDERFNTYNFHSLSVDDIVSAPTWRYNVSGRLCNYLNYGNSVYVIENTTDNESEKSKLYRLSFDLDN